MKKQLIETCVPENHLSKLTFPRSTDCILCHMDFNGNRWFNFSKNGNGRQSLSSPPEVLQRVAHGKSGPLQSHQPMSCRPSTRMS
jgi:hypothetical protein